MDLIKFYSGYWKTFWLKLSVNYLFVATKLV